MTTVTFFKTKIINQRPKLVKHFDSKGFSEAPYYRETSYPYLFLNGLLGFIATFCYLSIIGSILAFWYCGNFTFYATAETPVVLRAIYFIGTVPGSLFLELYNIYQNFFHSLSEFFNTVQFVTGCKPNFYQTANIMAVSDVLISVQSPSTAISLLQFAAVSVALAVILAVLPAVLTGESISIEQGSAYECGFEPFASKNQAFEVHFLIVGALFLIFDLELVFLLPAAMSGFISGLSALLNLSGFIILLTIGFIVEWYSGLLN